MNDEKLNITISILIIAAIFIAFFVYRSLFDVNGLELQKDNEIINNDKTGEIKELTEKDKNNETTEQLSITETAVYPDLNRPIIILSEDISSETQYIAEKRITELSSELKETPDLYGTWLELASYRKLIGDYFGAIEIWEFVGEQSNGYISYKNLGMLYHYDLPDYALSESYLRKAIKRDNTYIPTYLELHNLYKYSYKEKSDLADDVLFEGLLNNPKNIFLFSTLAEYYTEINDITKAIKYYKEALSEAEKNNDTATANQIQSRLDALQ